MVLQMSAKIWRKLCRVRHIAPVDEDERDADAVDDALQDERGDDGVDERDDDGVDDARHDASQTAEPDAARQFSFNLSADEFTSMKGTGFARGLTGDWYDVMYEHFHKVVPTCALAFNYNHCRRQQSRKQSSPFWVGKADCRTGNCITVVMSIAAEPQVYSAVQVSVVVHGTCTHKPDTNAEVTVERPNRRWLSGRKRTATGEQLASSPLSSSETHYRRLADMTEPELTAGNMTTCQTPPVLRQAAYESRRSTQLHENPVFELEIARECWQAAISGNHVVGYVQQLGFEPFHVVFYTEQQLDAYIQQCKSREGSVLHIDATGSVVKRIAGQKTPYYYCVLLGNGSLPVMDFITSKHDSSWLGGLLNNYNNSVRQVNGGHLVTPRHVVTDFSYAIIHASLQAFNSGMQLGSYLKFCFSALNGRCTTNQLKSITYMSLCVAHMLKAMSVRVTKVCEDKQIRKLTLTVFAALQRTTDLQSASALYRDVAWVLCCPHETAAVVDARLRLTARFAGLTCGEFDDNSAPCTPEMTPDDAEDLGTVDSKSTIRDQSPFTAYFADCIATVDVAIKCDSTENRTYAPRCFTQIVDMMHLYPLWAAALQADVERLAVDNASTDDMEPPTCRSNAAIESHFKAVKHGRLEGQLRVRPRKFVAVELSYVLGKLNERKLPTLRVQKPKELPATTEKWGRRKKPAAYNNAAKSQQLLTKLFKTSAHQSSNGSPKKRQASATADFQSAGRPHKKLLIADLPPAMDACTQDDNRQQPELNDDAVSTAMAHLRTAFPQIRGLEHVGCGQCVVGKSVPRFQAALEPFVQVFNVGDHYVCGTNVFSGAQHNAVYWYDSLHGVVSAASTLQVTSVLRRCLSSDAIKFHRRSCARQPTGTRLCGYYAVAAAYAICNGIDPTGCHYDVADLIATVRSRLQSGSTEPVPVARRTDAVDLRIQTARKRHCLCHAPSSGLRMVECSACYCWYHVSCVRVSQDQLRRQNAEWLGPCCQGRHLAAVPSAEELITIHD